MAASSTTGQGNSSFSSHSAAAGRITSAAKVCTHFCSSSWSGPSSKLGAVTERSSLTPARLPAGQPTVTSNVQLSTTLPATNQGTSDFLMTFHLYVAGEDSVPVPSVAVMVTLCLPSLTIHLPVQRVGVSASSSSWTSSSPTSAR